MEWVEDADVDGVYMMLPAGQHLYLLAHLEDGMSILRVLDPATMKQNTAFPDQRFEQLNILYKLSEDFILLGSEQDKIFIVSTRTNKLVSTLQI